MDDYTELVKRLRERSVFLFPHHGESRSYDADIMHEAADAIEELQKNRVCRIVEKDGETELFVENRWIPVTERLPEEELAFYLCYTDDWIVVECLWTNNKYGLGPFGEWGWRLMDVPQYQKVTHWMPLRGMTRTEFENKELAEFLEDAVHSLVDLDPNAIAIVAINDDRGIAGTQYYGCGVEDKGRMVHHINEDIIMDVILNNADIIRNAVMDAENDEDEEDDDEIE